MLKSVSSFKYKLDKYLSTIPDTPCIANYDNSLENSSHTNSHLLTGVHQASAPNSAKFRGGVAEGHPRFDKWGGVAIIFYFLRVKNRTF